MPRESAVLARRIVIASIAGILPGFAPRGERMQNAARSVKIRSSTGLKLCPKVGSMRKFVQTAVAAIPIVLALSPIRAEIAKQPGPTKHPALPAPVVRHLGAAEGWAAYTYKGH